VSIGDLVANLTAEGDRVDDCASFWMTPEVPLAAFLKRMGRSLVDGDDAAVYEFGDAKKEWPGREQEIKNAIDRALPLCESPIERILLPWLLTRHYRPFEFMPTVLLPGEGAKLEYGHIALVPQMPLGRFRADFVLAGRGREFVRFFVIECDGADYHEDREKDDARDAQIRKENGRVKAIIRLSGGNIMNRPRESAEIVRAIVSREYSCR
jgi:very-short-patch-repair endonuclease